MLSPGRWSLVALLLSAAGCGTVTAPSADPTAAAHAEPLAVQEPIAGLPYDDPRLDPVITELRANPKWLDTPLDAEPIVLALIPSTSELCLAIRGPDGDIHVAIEPSTPWSVAAVALDRGDAGRDFTFDPEGLASDVCTFVAIGRSEPWPGNAAAVEVSGNVDAGVAAAVAAAVHLRPDRFGIDATGVPAVLVGDRVEPSPEGWTCLNAVIFVGGPRSEVVLGTRPTGAGWEVRSRVVERALLVPEPRRPGDC